jgi:Holliday junction DNA helicase RuvB
MAEILNRSTKILKIDSDNKGVKEIAIRSRKTPRIANRLLRRVRDFSQVQSDGKINASIVKKALNQLEVDNLGLDKIDVELLESLVKKFDGGPVGLQTLAASISEDPTTVEDVMEPFLLNLGFISRTNRGRVATKLAYEHLGIDIKDEPSQGTLLN